MSQMGDFRGRGFREASSGRGRGGDPGAGRGYFRGRGRGDDTRGGRGGDSYRGRGRLGGHSGPIIFGSGQAVPVTTANHDALVQKLKTVLILPDSDLLLRPGSGTIGTPIQLRANHFPVTFSKSLYEYQVEIVPKEKTKAVRMRIYELLEASPAFAPYRGRVAHDSTTKLISTTRFPQDKIEAQVSYYDAGEGPPNKEAKVYKITVKFLRVIEKQEMDSFIEGDLDYRKWNIQPNIAALNIVLARYPTHHGGIMVGQSKIYFNDDVFNLGVGLEAHKGFFASIRPSFKQLMVNVNVVATAFYKEGNLADAMRSYQEVTDDPMDSFLHGLRVQQSYLSYKPKKAIYLVHDKGARQQKFHCDELGGEVSVEEYFRKKHGKVLRHPDLPLINLGNAKREVYVPAELCDILPDQPLWKRKLPEDITKALTKAMINYTCQLPAANASAITTKGLPSLGFVSSLPPNPLAEFGISVDREMAVVPGRVLPAPKVNYNRGSIAVTGGSWNLRDVKFKVGADLGKWGVLIVSGGGVDDFGGPDDPNLLDLIRSFAGMCRKSGMISNIPPKIASADLTRDKNRSTAAITKGIRDAITSTLPRDTSVILVILSGGDKRIYNSIKHLCDCTLDVHTVCVQVKEFRKGSPQYLANVALKVNLKLGGTNHVLDPSSMTWFAKQPDQVMLVGADVTHPAPDNPKGTPSVVAVVASNDRHYAQYHCSLRIQDGTIEMIHDLEAMMVERLKSFKKKNNDLPARVLYFRDGVSEGQFLLVLRDELPQIHSAFNSFSTTAKPYKPKLTIAIAVKRHHTRFYPTTAHQADPKGNPKPGTVVDRGVTSVFHFDFYLQAHAGLQGTTKPTHYNIIYDDNKFTADEIQTLIHNTSYTFQRATKAVSLIPPSYYADLACERGRCYLHDIFLARARTNKSLSEAEKKADKARVYGEAEKRWGNGVGARLRETMFYI